MLTCGLLGEHLLHSFSPAIHAMLGDYSYSLFEQAPEQVETFLKNGKWDGLNVTIPYKKTVIPFLDSLGEAAAAIGSVNTIVRKPDGTLYGENTDAYGFRKMIKHSGISVENRKVLVLGNGGAAASVLYVLNGLGAKPVVISRKGPDNYDNLEKHADAEGIVNTTPLGMYPNNGESAVSLSHFPKCKGVLDLIYNPARTALLLDAESRGIPYENGLYMLVAQAKRSAELFTGQAIDDAEIDRIYGILSKRLMNIVLIGMPGCGKSTVAKQLGLRTGRTVLDADEAFGKRYGMTPEEVINTKGEPEFRRMETEVLRELGKQSGIVLSTGGGAVTRDENYPLLHQNGVIFLLQRDIAALETAHRPLSQKRTPAELYAEREPMYRRFADFTEPVTDDTADRILDRMEKEK